MLSTSVCISKLWALDSLGIPDPSEKKTAFELQDAEKQDFLDKVSIEKDKFVVNLLRIEGHIPFPDNLEFPAKRLYKIVKNLKAKDCSNHTERCLNNGYKKILKRCQNVKFNNSPCSAFTSSSKFLPRTVQLKSYQCLMPRQNGKVHRV
ncbi:hypothetical protein TNCT_704951 [Trichonephila clavata]|uniref:Uncharacterized protein n=1 Tax=Trichonephila clavata TaxID=2740835 RepID=A0A8X6FJR1_TRICU|nr:hypothetical protein TNCT_704951 [Trichonephila clavata]